MARKKSKNKTKEALNPLQFMHQPHDKYARFVLQSKMVALELIEFCLPAHVFSSIDTASLELSNDSFVDARLRAHFSDICYSGLTNNKEAVRISIIFEHKSEKPEYPVREQLIRYISNIWRNDIKQKRELSVTLPILLYHGNLPIDMETTGSLFPGVPEALHQFIPTFNYVLVDICRLSDSIIENLEFLFLRNIFLALKYSRDEEYLEQYWKKIVIFATDLRENGAHIDVFQATIFYMSRVSYVFNEKIEEMDTVLSSTENYVERPYVVRLYEDGLEKGMEKGREKGREEGREEGLEKAILAFWKKNPGWTAAQIASTFEISVEKVKLLQSKVASGQ